ncbi:MAG: RagB/SusD family nutrient uptake outer membrane protein [Chitinophagaceae bacterium]
MKKTIINCLMLGVVVLAACNKKLDIKPFQSIDQETALSSEKDVVVTLVGAYDGLQSTAALGGDIMLMNELIGNNDDIRFTGTFAGLSDAWRLEMVADNTFALGIWTQAYNTINRCNNVLSGLDKVTSSTATRNRIEGEALFIRSTLYFELVRLFGKTWGDGNNATNPGVPLVLTKTTGITDADYRPRNSVQEVYQQVITDLTRAESLLPNTNTIFAAKNAAAAVLSRVYLQQGDYANARDAANRIIASGRNPLAATFPGLWFTFMTNAGNSPAEYIFSMRVTTQDGTNGLNTYFGTNAGAGTAGRSDCKINNSHLAKYETGDARRYFITLSGANYTRKHLDRFGNVPYVRTAEMLLTRAEANFRLGTSTGATPLADVNTVRARAGLAPLTSVTLDDILKERYLETAFEGNRLHDVKRLRGTIGTAANAWNNPKLILPIPLREMDVNKNLVQNQGY